MLTNKLLASDININDLVMVEFDTPKGAKQNYVGQICKIDQNELTCKFLRKNIKMSGFYCFPFIIE